LFSTFEFYELELAAYGAQHSGNDIDWSELVRDRDAGFYMLSIASVQLGVSFQTLRHTLCIHTRSGMRCGIYFSFGSYHYSALHVFTEKATSNYRMELPFNNVSVMSIDVDADIIKVVSSRQGMPSRGVVQFRAARLGEKVVIVTADAVGSIIPIGPYDILAIGSQGHHSGKLYPGLSGSPLIATTDGCIVGIHTGQTSVGATDVGLFTDGARCNAL